MSKRYPHECDVDHLCEMIAETLKQLHEIEECDELTCDYCIDLKEGGSDE